MAREEFGPEWRVAPTFGHRKLNLRPTGAPGWITGEVDAPGALDLCFITSVTPDGIVAHLRSANRRFAPGGVAVPSHLARHRAGPVPNSARSDR